MKTQEVKENTPHTQTPTHTQPPFGGLWCQKEACRQPRLPTMVMVVLHCEEEKREKKDRSKLLQLLLVALLRQ